MVLLVAMISLDMPNFRSLVAMDAEFASFNILHHNTLLEEIIISSTRIRRVNGKLYLYCNDTFPHAKIHFMVIELR